jgi:TPR repeat protein
LSYIYGDGVEQDIHEGFEYILQSAEKGYRESQYLLAQLYEKGIKGTPEKDKAAQWYIKLAHTGHVQAMAKVAELYEHNIIETESSAQSHEKALYWNMKAAEKNNKDALFKMGLLKKEQGAYSSAQEYFEKAAKQGHLRSIYFSTLLSFQGKGYIRLNDFEIFSRLNIYYNGCITHKQQIEDDVYFMLAELYAQGRGVPQNSIPAEIYYEKSIKHFSYSVSMGKLGLLYYFKAQKNDDQSLYKKAYTHMYNAYQKGYVSCAYTLAEMCYYGTGVKVDKLRTEQFLKEAVNDTSTSSDAYYMLAYIYYNDAFYKTCKNQAYTLCCKAMEKDHLDAYILCAVMHEKGEGVEKDLQKSLSLLRSSCEKGNTKAYRMIADYYTIYGTDDEKNTYVLDYLNKGIRSGDTRCYYYLAELYKNGDIVAKNYKKAQKYFEKVLHFGDKNIHHEYAVLLYNMNKKSKAKSYFLDLCNKGFTLSYPYLGRIYYESKKYNQAFKWLFSALPYSQKTYQYLYDIYIQTVVIFLENHLLLQGIY